MREPPIIIAVPGAPTFFGFPRPPEHYAIPLEVSVRLGVLGVHCLVVGAFGAAMLAMVGLIALEPETLLRSYNSLVVAAVLVMGVVLAFPAATLLFDRLRPQPLVYLGRNSFYDARALKRPIGWSEVAHAKVTYQVPNIRRAPDEAAMLAFGVTLTLRRPIAARHNPFRLGTFGFKWRRKSDEIYIPLLLLDVKPHALADSILALVARHGGTSER